MVLVDTSVWVDHFRVTSGSLASRLKMVEDDELLLFLERHALMGRSVGLIDVQLLASCHLDLIKSAFCSLWAGPIRHPSKPAYKPDTTLSSGNIRAGLCLLLHACLVLATVSELSAAALTLQATVLRTGTVHLQWSETTDGNNRPPSFAIYRRQIGGRDQQPHRLTEVNAHEWFDRDTLADTQYEYRVALLDLGGQTERFSAVTSTRVTTTLPTQPPLTFHAISRPDQIELRWRFPPENRVGAVRLYQLPEGVRDLTQGQLVTEVAPEAGRRLHFTASGGGRAADGLPDPLGTGRVEAQPPPFFVDWAAVVITPEGESLEPVFSATSGIIPQSRHYHTRGQPGPSLLLNQAEIEAIHHLIDRDPLFRQAYEKGLLVDVRNAWEALRHENRHIPRRRGGAHSGIWRNLRHLGLGYAFTGDHQYAEAVREILLEYATFYSTLPIPRSYADAYLTSTHVEGRMFVEAAWAYDLIKDILSTTDRQEIARGLFRPGAELLLRHNRGTSNWQSGHNAGLMAIAIVLDDENLFREILHRPGGFLYQLEHAIREDGMWIELSIAYHYYAMHAVTMGAELAYRYGYDLYRTNIGGHSLLRYYDAPFYHAFSNFNQATFGNAQPSRQLTAGWVVWNHAVAHARYAQPHYHWLWQQNSMIPARLTGQSNLPVLLQLWHLHQGGPPSDNFAIGTETIDDGIRNVVGSTLLSGAGVAILRGPAAASAPELAVTYQPTGKIAGHMHPNTLGLCWQSNRHRWLYSSGKWDSYGSDVHRGWVIQSLSDNLVVVDRQSQYPARGREAWVSDEAGRLSSGTLEAFTAGPLFGYVQIHSNRLYENVTQRRRLFHADAYTIDIFHSSSPRSRTYDWVLHIAGELKNSSLGLRPRSQPLADGDGYPFLSELRETKSGNNWTTRWQESGLGEELLITTLGTRDSQLYLARSPWDGRDRGSVMVSRQGLQSNFISLLQTADPQSTTPPARMEWLHQTPFSQQESAGILQVTTSEFIDYFFWHDQPTAARANGIAFHGLALASRFNRHGALLEATLVQSDRLASANLNLRANTPVSMSIRKLDNRGFLIIFDDEYIAELDLVSPIFNSDVQWLAYELNPQGEIEKEVPLSSAGSGSSTFLMSPRRNYLLLTAEADLNEKFWPSLSKQIGRQ